MNFNFISPIYLLGLLGISLPILVHFLTRRRRTHIKFSAVYLLLQSEKRSIERAKPNRLLLLFFRCLAIACLSLALANPIFSQGPSDELLAHVPSANVFIVDDSYSMETRTKNATLYAEALTALADVLKNIAHGSSFSLVLASAPARVLQDWVADREILLKKLKLSQPSYRTTDIGGAVSEAQKLLETVSQKNKRIFILTDMDRNGWNEENFPKRGLDSVTVNIMDFSGSRKGHNRAAVNRVSVTQEFLTNSKIIRVKAGITNLLPEKGLRNLPVTLWVGGKKQSEISVDVPAGSTVEREFSFPHLNHHQVDGFVEIGDDALTADNRRYFTYQPDRKIKVLVVDGDPNTVAHQSETFYIERALNPFYGSFSDIEPTISTLNELTARNLMFYSVVILCNVRELPPLYELELEKFIVRGGALFIALGDKVDPKFYNEKMGNLLPVTFETLNQVVELDKPFHLLVEPRRHPVLQLFKSRVRKEMQDIRFDALYEVQARAGKTLTIPMRFRNGLPAVVESEFGKGKVILFVSSIDRDWNEFPIQPTFLPWIQRWVKYSARSLESISRQSLLVGQSFVLGGEVTGGGSFYLETPGGRIRLLARKSKEESFEPSYRPGVYRVYRAPLQPAAQVDAADKPVPEKIFKLPSGVEKIGDFTINVDIRESDSTKISRAGAHKMLAVMASVAITDPISGKPETETKGTPLTTPFLLLMTLALFWEGWHVRKE